MPNGDPYFRNYLTCRLCKYLVPDSRRPVAETFASSCSRDPQCFDAFGWESERASGL